MPRITVSRRGAFSRPLEQGLLGVLTVGKGDPDELRTLLPDMALDRDWSNVTEAEALVVDGIERVRRNGIALEQDIHGEGARSLAVPARRWLDKPIVAIEVTAPAGIHTMEELLARLGPPLKHAAKLISV